MGNEAVSPDVETEDKPTEPETVESEDPPEGGESEEGGEDQEAPKVEGDQDGDDDDGSSKQHDIDRTVQRRLKRERKKTATATENAEQQAIELTNEKLKNELLTLALEQKNDIGQAANQIPNPDDFENGTQDPEYIQALTTHTQNSTAALIREEVQKATAGVTAQRNEDDEAHRFTQRREEHIRSSIDLEADDYEETEDAVIDILGQKNVDQIIKASPDAHIILYYMGKNLHEAESIRDLLASDPVKGVLQVGRLEAIAKGSPTANLKPTPDPDDELEGGSPSAGQTNRHQRAVDAARLKAQENGDIDAVLDAKKVAREAGVTVV